MGVGCVLMSNAVLFTWARLSAAGQKLPPEDSGRGLGEETFTSHGGPNKQCEAPSTPDGRNRTSSGCSEPAFQEKQLNEGPTDMDHRVGMD